MTRPQESDQQLHKFSNLAYIFLDISYLKTYRQVSTIKLYLFCPFWINFGFICVLQPQDEVHPTQTKQIRLYSRNMATIRNFRTPYQRSAEKHKIDPPYSINIKKYTGTESKNVSLQRLFKASSIFNSSIQILLIHRLFRVRKEYHLKKRSNNKSPASQTRNLSCRVRTILSRLQKPTSNIIIT